MILDNTAADSQGNRYVYDGHSQPSASLSQRSTISDSSARCCRSLRWNSISAVGRGQPFTCQRNASSSTHSSTFLSARRRCFRAITAL